MSCEYLQSIVGEQVIYGKSIVEITGVHIYINKKGVQSCKLHLSGIEGYVNINDVEFFKIIKVGE